MNALTKTLAIMLPIAMLWGCSTTGPSGTDAAAGDAAVTGAVAAGTDISGVEVSGVQEGRGIAGSQMDDSYSTNGGDTEGLLSQRVVYFDFDRSSIKSEARAVIEAHAQHLAANPSARVTLEGHCDERGTREYNLSLGERRAKAVQQVMVLLGVSARQIEFVSYGEERPAAMGHSESAWRLNRRVELVYN